MRRAVCYDVTHLVSRLGITAPSGIDKVDLAYGRHFAANPQGPGIHYGLRQPHVMRSEWIGEVVARYDQHVWEADDAAEDQKFTALRCALVHGRANNPGRSGDKAERPGAASPKSALNLEIDRMRRRLSNDAETVPPGAIYLNVAQHVFEDGRFFSWLTERPDVRSVFLLHDLLPLDYPEYFRPADKSHFYKRTLTAFEHARALIVTTNAVRERIQIEFTRRGHMPVPIHVAALPSSLEGAPARCPAAPDPDGDMSAVPYFVVLGTIEPRKNHLLLLNIWRQLAELGGDVPKLVIVGGRGWHNGQILDVLDRGVLTRPHIFEAAGLSTAGLTRLLANARALLMPSFAEGYGLPLVEALAVGTPVVASDIPVFREVTQGCAIYHHPLDGPGWRQSILDLADPGSSVRPDARTRAAEFCPPDWVSYFKGVDAFLQNF